MAAKKPASAGKKKTAAKRGAAPAGRGAGRGKNTAPQRPTAEQVGRDNIAMDLMQLIWRADASNNVCPSIHCQSSGCMALAFAKSRLAQGRPWLKVLAFGWAGLICASTVFTKQHSIIDVACGLALVAVWYWPLYGRKTAAPAGR